LFITASLRPREGRDLRPVLFYGARDENGERHWRSSLDDLQQLIDKGFAIEDAEQ